MCNFKPIALLFVINKVLEHNFMIAEKLKSAYFAIPALDK